MSQSKSPDKTKASQISKNQKTQNDNKTFDKESAPVPSSTFEDSMDFEVDINDTENRVLH